VDLEPLRHLEIHWLPPSRRLGFVWGPDETPAGSSGGVDFALEPLGGDGAATRLTVVERPPVSPGTPARPSALALS
jgi:hypothetical protein